MEELAQTFLGDIADDGKINTSLGDYASSFGLGALGGGMMSGVGRGISRGRMALGEKFKAIDHKIDPVENPVQNAVMKAKIANEITINRLSPSQIKYNIMLRKLWELFMEILARE